MTDEEILRESGFEVCQWHPKIEDVCESCGKTNIQLYFSGDGFDGTYWCLDCIVEMHKENERTRAEIVELEAAGHHPHCAARQVFGDGECECSIIANGYDPYAWQKI